MIDLNYIKYAKETRLNEINFYCNDNYIINCIYYNDVLTFVGVIYNDRLYSNSRYKIVKQGIELLKEHFMLCNNCDVSFDFDEKRKLLTLDLFNEDILHATRIVVTGLGSKDIYFNNDVIVKVKYLKHRKNEFYIDNIVFNSQDFNFYKYDGVLVPIQVKTIIELIYKECFFIDGATDYKVHNLMFNNKYRYIKNAVVNYNLKTITLFNYFAEAIRYKNLIKFDYECFVIHNNCKWLTFSYDANEITLKLILNELDYEIIDYRYKEA